MERSRIERAPDSVAALKARVALVCAVVAEAVRLEGLAQITIANAHHAARIAHNAAESLMALIHYVIEDVNACESSALAEMLEQLRNAAGDVPSSVKSFFDAMTSLKSASDAVRDRSDSCTTVEVAKAACVALEDGVLGFLEWKASSAAPSSAPSIDPLQLVDPWSSTNARGRGTSSAASSIDPLQLFDPWSSTNARGRGTYSAAPSIDPLQLFDPWSSTNARDRETSSAAPSTVAVSSSDAASPIDPLQLFDPWSSTNARGSRTSSAALPNA